MLNEDVRDSIGRLVSKIGKKDNELFLTEILTTISRMAEQNINAGDWKLFCRSSKEFRKSFGLFEQYRGIRKVCIFGSARTQPNHPEFFLAEEFAKQVVDAGYMVITGAGPGIMAAGNKGAGAEKSFGVNIRLPFEQSANEYILGDPKLIDYNYFFVRKLMFIKESDATVLFPGGFGTLDEAYEGLTLMQTGKSQPRPVVFVETEGAGYWDQFIRFFGEVMLAQGYISPDDMDLFHVVHSAEEAVQIIDDFYRHYHSIRYVRHNAVLRLNTEPTAALLDRLNDEFSDIVVDGKIDSVEPFPEEKMGRDFLKKPRIAFHFNKINFGRIVKMIRVINEVLRE